MYGCSFSVCLPLPSLESEVLYELEVLVSCEEGLFVVGHDAGNKEVEFAYGLAFPPQLGIDLGGFLAGLKGQ